MQNYLIYFATLILGVAIFYVFNALGSQTVMLKVSKEDIKRAYERGDVCRQCVRIDVLGFSSCTQVPS